MMTTKLCHKVCKRSNLFKKTFLLPGYKMPTKIPSIFLLIGTLASILASFYVCADAYQLPIQQHSNRERHRLTNTQQQQHLQNVLEPKKPSFIQNLNMPELSFDTQHRSDDAQKVTNDVVNSAENEDSDELRELHQAVDTVAQLLNEEERQQKERQRQQQQQQEQQHSFGAQNLDSSDTSLNVLKTQPELMSEGAIREAIKQLEQVQQQERRDALEAESKVRPIIAENPSSNFANLAPAPLQPQALKAKQATLSGLIEELGDEFTDEQIAAASQEAERILGQSNNLPRITGQSVVENTNKQRNDKEQEKALAQEAQYTSSTPISSQKQSQQEATQSTSQNSNEKSLLVGQLDSLSSELGPALTNDFYTFHADSNGAERGETSISAPQNNQYQDSAASNSQKQQTAQPHNDLESAAQTRSSIAQDPSQASNPFRQDSNTIRFDFNQPAPISPQPLAPKQPRQLQPLSNSQDELVRAFRQQTGANIGNEQYATTTLIPISSQDNFWRPSGGGQTENIEDISEQYNKALASPQQNSPHLPPSRFQNSNLSGQFSQPVASSRQAQHIHYTGHSLIPSTQSQTQFPAPQQVGNSRDRLFVSTTPPLISVLSNSDTSGGNSVLWNPPATLNPPALAPSPQLQPSFSQRPQSSTQPPSPPSLNVDGIGAQFFAPSNRGPPSPLFSGAFPGVTESSQPRKPISPRDREFKPQLNQNNAVTETNSNVEVTTEGRFAQPTTTTQWSPPAVSDRPVERDVSDSQPRSSFRSSQNSNQRFFPPNDLIGPSTTLSSANTEPPRAPRANTPPAVVTTTPSSPVQNSTAKKEDMVIYYYYYYDDNKNATVVAKNVTSSPSAASPSNLDAAIEADGGIEDTPYMDDPAPIVNPRPSSLKPSSSTTTSTTTTTTTTTASPPPISSTFPNSIHDNRFRSSLTSSKAPSGNDFISGSGRQTSFDRELTSNQFNDFVKPTFVEQPRGPVVMPSRGPLPVSREKQPVSEQSFTATPFSTPFTSSFKPISRLPANRDSHTGNRIVSTEPSVSHTSSTQSNPSRIDSGSHHRHQQPVDQNHPVPHALPNNKLQADLIQNVLNGINNSHPRQASSFSTVPTPVSSSTSSSSSSSISSGSGGASRGPLSNASRYGTNNNLMLDPYGLDPAAPATLVHSSHVTDTSAIHHKNWQPNASQGFSHQFNRKPAAVTESSAISTTSSSENPTSARAQSSSANRTGNQHFASQRNSNTATNFAPIPSRAPQQPMPGSRVSGSMNKQFFPESNNQISNNAIDQNRNDQAVGVSPKQVPQEQSSPPLKIQSTRQFSSIPSDDFSGTRLSSEEFNPRLQTTNGRPSTPDGNTGNGFTRSPIQTTPVSTPAPFSPTSSRTQSSTMSESISSSLSSTTQPSISTSVSRSFVTPQQVQVTTSVSQPTVTSTTTVTSTSQSSPMVPSTTPQQNTSTSQASISSQSNVSNTATTAPIATQEPSQPTESFDSVNTSTRKRFGNRTNRFQTRINSLSASRSTSTTTSTTSSPLISSTTRRPTTSTTRKSSKQLFPGRRRLSSNPQQSADAANNTLAVATSSSSSSASTSDSSPASSSPGRSRFGNSFTARTRSSKANSVQIQELSSTTQKPASLFGAQKTSSKPRLPFLKSAKPIAATTNGEGGQSSGELASGNLSNSVPMDTNPTSSDKPSTEKSTVNETGSDYPGEDASPGSSDDESAEMKKDLASITPNNNNNNTSMVPEATTTAAPSPTTAADAPSSRNKPKLRPLFASRQRSSSLFGNRRSNGNSTTTS